MTEEQLSEFEKGRISMAETVLNRIEECRTMSYGMPYECFKLVGEEDIEFIKRVSGIK